jgi:protoporphyrinogen oxidase
MRTEDVHTLILGAGPAGLAAGHSLAQAGLKPIILEKDKAPGGLMRSIHRGDFVVDVGRKELYNRLAKVDEFWSKLLGPDYRPYPHRGGILYEGQIVDMSPAFQGFRRGMPWGMFLATGFELLWCRIKPASNPPRNVEEYFYQTRGRRMTRTFAQGFQEKLTGKKWADLRLTPNVATEKEPGLFATLKAVIDRAFSKKEVNTFKGIWRHPAKGSGQICDLMAQGMEQAGGKFLYQSKLISMEAGDGKINGVVAEVGGETVNFRPQFVVSSVPLEILRGYLIPDPAAGAVKPKPGGVAPRTVILAYLFLNEEPRFPQAWLHVTSPDTRIGRITNYTAFNGEMVPKGKTCLCCEYYCFGPDPLLDMDSAAIAKMALDDCAKFGLVDPSTFFDHLVLKLPGADASQNRDNWMVKSRLKLVEELAQFKNLYCVNRTETDIATLAGLESAEAILSGQRADFDRRIDPAELGIRSDSKSFEFALPSNVER